MGRFSHSVDEGSAITPILPDRHERVKPGPRTRRREWFNEAKAAGAQRSSFGRGRRTNSSSPVHHEAARSPGPLLLGTPAAHLVHLRASSGGLRDSPGQARYVWQTAFCIDTP